MSDEYDEYDETDTSDASEAFKNLRKQHRQSAQELREAKEALAKYQAQERATTVREVLKAKGLPEKVADLYSGTDVSEAAVVQWAEQYADVFGSNSSSGQSSDNSNNGNAQSANRVNEATGGNVHPTQNPKGPSGRILGSPEEIQHAIDTWKYEDLVAAGYMPDDRGQLYGSRR